ncbi:LL-diaminopimelate aminotransferase apoenzyme [Anaerolinea thermolimosa]|uniref:LL-diaminopimelate aminotransferase n=1 Tax=Anaerolinea thermolimosa TaxID=229919 RepID=UPI0007817899|nr:LL-diaminopimelate aminotransferase [Anaerolinea thermolimosa]GAP06621.1 LL-diaminopimelate aminotransferase apoenzyme [Anaerolinea thermolimosa]
MNEYENYTFIQPADRIASFKPYFFASLNQKIAQLRAQGMDVIRLDMGSPDLPPADFIIDALIQSARRPDTHGYSPNGGTPAFRKAVAEYYLNRFDVSLDPQKEVLALVGSKEGLFNLSQVLLNPGDISLVPDPGYPVYAAGSMIAGAEVYPMPLLKENGFLPDLDAIPPEVARRAKILWLNYPNNPTGAVATYDFYMKVIEFAHRYQVLVASDAPYTDICFEGYRAPSILQIPGAREVTVEFNSLSKTYNMAGWRLGMAVGNARVISYLHTYKSQSDSSQFQAILDAGTVALTGDQSWIEQRNDIYRQRRDIVVQGLREAGFTVDIPPAAIYVWAKLPPGHNDSTDFCTRLLESTGVSVTPGIVYGAHGEGYLRVSLGTDTELIQKAMERIKGWIKE